MPHQMLLNLGRRVFATPGPLCKARVGLFIRVGKETYEKLSGLMLGREGQRLYDVRATWTSECRVYPVGMIRRHEYDSTFLRYRSVKYVQ